MKMITCGSQAGWVLQNGPMVCFSALGVRCMGRPSCALLTGPQEARACYSASELLRPLRWFSLEGFKEPKGTSSWCSFAEGLFPPQLLDLPPCTQWVIHVHSSVLRLLYEISSCVTEREGSGSDVLWTRLEECPLFLAQQGQCFCSQDSSYDISVYGMSRL